MQRSPPHGLRCWGRGWGWASVCVAALWGVEEVLEPAVGAGMSEICLRLFAPRDAW